MHDTAFNCCYPNSTILIHGHTGQILRAPRFKYFQHNSSLCVLNNGQFLRRAGKYIVPLSAQLLINQTMINFSAVLVHGHSMMNLSFLINSLINEKKNGLKLSERTFEIYQTRTTLNCTLNSAEHW